MTDRHDMQNGTEKKQYVSHRQKGIDKNVILVHFRRIINLMLLKLSILLLGVWMTY